PRHRARGGRGRRFRRRVLSCGDRGGDGEDGDVLVAENVHAGGGFDFAEVDGVTDLEAADVDVDDFRQVLGQAADLDFEQHVLEHSAAVLDTGGFAHRFDGDQDGDFFGF